VGLAVQRGPVDVAMRRIAGMGCICNRGLSELVQVLVESANGKVVVGGSVWESGYVTMT
jgi:hypothetical protein